MRPDDRPADGAPAAGGRRWPVWAAAGVIALAVLGAYFNSFRGPFLFDDEGCILNNPSIRSFQPIWGPLSPPESIGIVGRPVINLTLAINYAVSGLNVWSYHALNVTIHALAALILFGLLRRTLLLPVMQGRFDRGACREQRRTATVLATAVALLWALHPLQTQAVTYVIQRCESLMGLFFLLTLYCLLRGSTSRRAAVWYVASAAACAAGMGCKAVMVVAPVLALLYDALFLTGAFRQSLRRRWGLHLGLAATWGLLAGLLIGAPGETAGFNARVSPLAYALTQLWVIPHYLLLTFWPRELVLDYGLSPITDWQRLLAPGLVLAGLVVATAWAMWRHRLWGFLGLWFFLILAPTSSILPVPDAIFEHRMYLSLAAVAALLVVGGYLLGRRLAAWRKAPAALGWAVGAALVAAAVAALGARTYLRNADYRTSTSIWQDTAAKRPDNYRAHYNLGNCYRDGDWLDRAIEQYTRTIELCGQHVEAHNNRALCYQTQRRFDLVQKDLERAVELQPNNFLGYYNRGLFYLTQGRLEQGMKDLDRAVSLKPDQPELYLNRGDAYRTMGQYYLAIVDYGAAVALRPNYPQACNGRGLCYQSMKQYEQAERDYDRAIALAPLAAAVYGNRAIARFSRKDYPGAWEDVKQCRKLGGVLDPKFMALLTAASGRRE